MLKYLQSRYLNRRRAVPREVQKLLAGLMIPFAMMILNVVMFGVALPTVRAGFNIQADVTSWLVTAYMLPFITLMPLYGRLGDGLGKRRLLLAGVSVFLAGTTINLAAAGLPWLIVGRVIQGVGAAGINPLCIAIISERFAPEERGQALGTWNAVGPAAAVVGPLLAGFLIDRWGWRPIFGPVWLAGLLALWLVKSLVPAGDRPFVQPGFLRTLDWGGVGLLAATTTALVFYVSSRPITGVEPLQDWRLLGLAVLFFAAFLFWEKQQSNPFVPLGIFNYRSFSRASLGAGVRMFTMSSVTGFLLPLYLHDVHRLNAAAIGVIAMLHAGALLVTMRLGGRQADRWGSRWLVVGGAAVQATVMVYLALLPGTVWVGAVALGLVIHGLGAGVYLAALHRSAMSRVPMPQTGVAAGLYSMVRFSGTMLGIALAGVLLQYGLDRAWPSIQAYQLVFWFVAAVALAGVVTGWGLRE